MCKKLTFGKNISYTQWNPLINSLSWQQYHWHSTYILNCLDSLITLLIHAHVHASVCMCTYTHTHTIFQICFQTSKTFPWLQFNDLSRPGIFHFQFQDFSSFPGPVQSMFLTHDQLHWLDQGKQRLDQVTSLTSGSREYLSLRYFKMDAFSPQRCSPEKNKTELELTVCKMIYFPASSVSKTITLKYLPLLCTRSSRHSCLLTHMLLLLVHICQIE